MCIHIRTLKLAVCFPVFVGQTDSVQCNFELADGCPWQLGVNVSVVMAGESGALNIDASSDPRGTQVDNIVYIIYTF